MKFEKGKQYKCVENTSGAFTVGKVYHIEEDGSMENDFGNLVWPINSKFTFHEEVKRGDYALFWDGSHDEDCPEKRIYLATIEGSTYPHIVVSCGEETIFKEGGSFNHFEYKNMKPLPQPIEVPMKEALSILKANKGSDCVIVEDDKH